MMRPLSTLLLLVTCSRDESRRDLAVTVTSNLAKLLPDAGFSSSFVVFDNDSSFHDHFSAVPQGAVVCRAERNIGYWSAINWVINRRAELFNHEFTYLYIVESDHFVIDLSDLSECEEFLKSEPRASGVRTQEFSVRWRWRYDKRLRMLPFYKARSAVQMCNAVTGERAWFRKAPGLAHIYLSNLHTRLPELNRLAALETTFRELSMMDEFTEADFFRLMMRDHPYVGVHDPGLYYPLIEPHARRTITGSFSNSAELEAVGYKKTRVARIESGPFHVDVVRT